MPKGIDKEDTPELCPDCESRLWAKDNGKLHCIECGEEKSPKK